MQSRMSESLLEPMALIIRSLRMDLGRLDFGIGRCVISELFDKSAGEVDFEDEDEEDWRDGGYPHECPESELQADR